MSSCEARGDRVEELHQQVSVMRREIKNLRRLLGSAAGSHRKHVASLRSLVSNMGHEGSALPQAAPNAGTLEQGNIQTVPIGYISSCFSVKNGTPRQPTICGPSRATLRVRKSVFNNPEHALLGLEHFSHVWVIFLFHKNGHLSYKAKVKPPRLNGQRVGVYSTRSPHRPNALGLTLAKLDRIEGDTIHLSDIDMIAGTPVLDIKPYIPDYDSPRSTSGADVEPCGSDVEPQEIAPVALDEVTAITQLCENSATSSSEAHENIHINVGEKAKINGQKGDAVLRSAASNISTHLNTVLREVRAYVDDTDPPEWNGAEKPTRPSDSPESNPPESAQHSSTLCFGASTIAGWVREPPVSGLEVRFTPHAERELERFLPPDHSGAPGDDRPRFNFLCSAGEAVAAIRGVLSADPRSVYRRTRCVDRLFFFTLDTAHITCWFGRGFAEVLRVQPVELEPKKLST